jgi:hypothetical protein
VIPLGWAAAEAELDDALRSGDLSRAEDAARAIDALGPKPAATVLGAALWYAENGLHVFPLRPGEKVPPAGLKWRKEATCDPAAVRELFAAHPGANLGLATGHRVDVIDFDGPQAHADWGERYGERWEDAEVDVLATVSTPRPGGLHVYVPATGGPNKARMVGRFVDYRGLGGYVVAPPSVTPVGSYRFLRPLRPEVLP